MCCFSAHVDYVAATSIFARPLPGARQVLVYQMSFGATLDVAMVLPIPTPPRSDESAIEFVSLEDYPQFFAKVRAGFPAEMRAQGRGPLQSLSRSAPRLKVQRVGEFEASFVPTIADFHRLDPRFRIGPEIWNKLPSYADWGFAVFKLRAARAPWWRRLLRRGIANRKVHPMAFVFPTRDPASLFFPTVHVHDGEVHEMAEFDHTLYCQPDPKVASTFSWERSAKMMGELVDAEKCGVLIDETSHCFQRKIEGRFPNRDRALVTPQFADVGRLTFRGSHFELHFRARSQYYEEHANEDTRTAERRRTARLHLDELIDQLSSAIEKVVAQNAEAWRALPFDDSLHAYSLTASSELRSTRLAGPDGFPLTPTPEGALVVHFRIESDTVEPQEVRLAFVRPPEKEMLAAIKKSLEAELQGLVLPTEPRPPFGPNGLD